MSNTIKSARSVFLIVIVMILLSAPLLLSEEGNLSRSVNSVHLGTNAKADFGTQTNTSIHNGNLQISSKIPKKGSYTGNIPLLSGSNGSSKLTVPASSMNINGKKSYKVTFSEKGIPAGATWGIGIEKYIYNPVPNEVPQVYFGYLGTLIHINAFSSLYSTSGTSFSIYLPNGTYFYAVRYSGTYIGNKTLTVDGNSQLIQVKIPKLFKVTINEQNIPSGVSWELVEVSIDNMIYSSESSISSTITSYLPNGSYELIAGPESTSMVQNPILVEGKPLSLSLTFPKFYKVTFEEKNLHNGSTWYLGTSLEGQEAIYLNYTQNPTMIAYLPSDNYSYDYGFIPFQNETNTSEISSIMNTLTFNSTTNSGFVLVPSQSTTIIKFQQTYRVNFTASNVPYEATWGVSVMNNEIIASTYSGNTSVVGYLPNGDYCYMGYYSANVNVILSGKYFIINNSSKNIFLEFPELFKVTFTEKNVPAGVEWGISVNGYGRDISYTNSTSTSSLVAYLPIEMQGSTQKIGYRYSANIGQITYLQGQFTLNSTNTDISLVFPTTYKVTFTEKNLSEGLVWDLNVNTKNYSVSYVNSTSTTSMVAYLKNGSYDYNGRVLLPFEKIATSSKEFTVDGVSLNVVVLFPVTHKVTFTEMNVPNGITWSINVNDKNNSISYFNSTSSSSMVAYMPYGTYNYSGSYTAFFEISVPETEVNISGSLTNIALKFPFSYKVTFMEKNLAVGASWEVSLSRSNESREYGASNITTSSSMVAHLTNGTYNYTGDYYYFSHGSLTHISIAVKQFTVKNAAITVILVFPVTHKVTFTEMNVPKGITWSINVNDENNSITYSNSTSSSSMIAYLPYGTYNYSGSYMVYFEISVPNKEISFSSAENQFEVVFPLTYMVTFTEENVPAGFLWSINVHNKDYSISFSRSSTIPSMVLYLPNGIYYYNSYYSNDNSMDYSYVGIGQREFTVNNSTLSLSVLFPVTYHITFTERNLPKGIIWSMNLNNKNDSVSYYDSTSYSSITLYLPNGTYNYTGSYNSNIAHEQLTTKELRVSEKSLTVNLTFQEVYLVTFKESGLSNGIQWSVSLNNTELSSTSNEITFFAKNGSYQYSVISVSGFRVTNESGTISVLGKNYNQSISFTAREVKISKYTVTFTESGLPSGTSWSVTFNGTTETSTTDTITFTVANGTYSFAVGYLGEYTASPSSGSISVKGANANQAITFTPVKTTVSKYTVTFTESGLPSGTSWSVTFNGTTETSTTDTITFTVANGTYSYSIGNITGYKVDPLSGSLNINGSNTSQTITFSSNTTSKTPPKGISSDEIYAIEGAIAALIIIGASVAVVRRRK